jgi:hypothetical protein
MEKLTNENNIPLRVGYAISYIIDNNISIEQVKEDFKFIRKIERTYYKLYKDFVKTGQIVLSTKTEYYSIKDYKKRGETGTIMAIRYLINMLKYFYNIDIYDLNKYKNLVNKYFNSVGTLWFEYNKYNICKYSNYYVKWEYLRPTKTYIKNTDKKYYRIIKNLLLK